MNKYLLPILMLSLLGVLLGLGLHDHRVLSVLLCLYGALSVMTFLSYAVDKAAAQRQGRRIPEQRLHLLSLLGGWPGALLAQPLLRHKSAKRSFRIRFSMTLLLNLLLLGGVILLVPGRS